MKRLTALLTGVLVCLLLPTAAWAEELPILGEISVYPPVVAPGERFTVGADLWAEDGIQRAELRFRNDASGTDLIIPLRETMGYGKAAERFSGTLRLPDDLPEGDYTLRLAVIIDHHDLRSRYFRESEMKWDSPDAFVLEQPVNFLVDKNAPKDDDTVSAQGENRSGDTAAPALLSVAVAESRVSFGNPEYLVRVTAEDKSSGVEHVTVRFRNDANGRALSLTLDKAHLTNGVYERWLTVNRFEPAGTFVLDNVGVTDHAGNYAGYCRADKLRSGSGKRVLPNSASFLLTTDSTVPDSTPPTVTGLRLSASTADTGGTLQIWAQAADDRSGVDTVSVQWRNEDNKSISVALTADDTGEFTGWVKSFQSRTGGNYRLVRVSAIDRAGNRDSWYLNPEPGAPALTLSAPFRLGGD